MGRLTDSVALVTGGASGLGKAIAWRLAAEGARVVITDIDPIAGQRTASESGFSFLEQDVRDETRWVQVIGEAESLHGKLDILVNNAGILGASDALTPEDTRLTDWRNIFAVNVEGTFLGCRAVIPTMRRGGGGSIINLSSVAGLLATPYATAYGASKAAVRQLTKSVAQYCAEQNLHVRCNSIHPGDVRTPLLERHLTELARARGMAVDELIAQEKALCPLGDLTQPEDVAAAVAYLASEDARHVTGAELIVDGGLVNCDTFRWSGGAAGMSPGPRQP
jgi:3(or 17)beta-hydroxysteroid dehydrogenase